MTRVVPNRFTGYGREVLTNHIGGPTPTLRKWIIPTKTGPERHVILRDGSIGFLLAHFVLWWHEVVHPINIGVWDEWGWADRDVRGMGNVISEHAGGCAVDIDATQHPRGIPILRNFKVWQIAKIRARLLFYSGMLGWGGNYHRVVDGMHVEFAQGRTLQEAERVAKRLLNSPRGKRILAANPGAKTVILS